MTRLFFQKMSLSIIMAAVALFSALPYPAFALNIAARISDQSTEALGGDRLYFEVEIKYPENSRRKDLRLEYQIIDGGDVIASEKVLRAVETQASFLDYIVVPKSARKGTHSLNVVIADYDALREEVSATFQVLGGADKVTTYFFILLGAIVLIGGLAMAQIRGMRT